MRTELTEFKRCCFCVPLRYGLITWGYIKLVLTCFAFIYMLIFFCHDVIDTFTDPQKRVNLNRTGVFGAIVGLLLLDIVYVILFLVGGHKKSIKLLKLYYFYSLAMWLLLLLLAVAFFIHEFLTTPHPLLSYSSITEILDFSITFVYIALHTYFLLLLRSEIKILKSNCKFRFVNNATEAECKMSYKEEKREIKDLELSNPELPY